MVNDTVAPDAGDHTTNNPLADFDGDSSPKKEPETLNFGSERPVRARSRRRLLVPPLLQSPPLPPLTPALIRRRT